MSRRARALGFVLAALLAAAAAAAIADGYGDSVARGYGALRPVVVAVEPLRRGEPIDPAHAAALQTRRVPRRFVPAGSLRQPAEAIGLAPTAPVPAGAYLLAAQLQPPRRDGAPARFGRGLRPVEIAVAGAAALLLDGNRSAGGRVDVVVTAEPGAAGPGRTYVAAAAVPLLALTPSAPGAGVEGGARATLALTRHQALALIAAESFARRITLLPGG